LRNRGFAIAGVPVRVHWSLLAGVIVVIGAAGDRVVVASAASVAYVGCLLLHEWGHVLFARWRRCHVEGIELYLVLGLTRFQAPRDPFDHYLIAWGGIFLQAAVGLPMLAWITLVGYTPFEVLNALMAFVSFLTVVMTVLNLLPFPPLDDALAWRLIPQLLERWRSRRARQHRLR
jgi:Zn-dependent protease